MKRKQAHLDLTNFDVSSHLGKMNDVSFFKIHNIFSFPSSRIKLSSSWEEKTHTYINDVANNKKGIMDQSPFTPCGGFHLQEN